MRAVSDLIFSTATIPLNPQDPLIDFRNRFKDAIDMGRREVAALLLSFSAPISQHDSFFKEMLIGYLNTPKEIGRVHIVCGLLGLSGYTTPFTRLAEIAANLSQRNFKELDCQIYLLEQFLEKSHSPKLTIYVQEQLEFFQAERSPEIVMLLTHLQHYLHNEPPYDKPHSSLNGVQLDTGKKV